MLKELMNTGFGAAAMIKEKMEEEMKTCEEKNSSKKEHTKAFFESLEKKGKEEEQKARDEIKKMMKEVIDELGLATKEDLQKLKEDLK